MRRLDKTIPQNTKRNRDNDWYVKNGEGYRKDSRSGEYDDNQDGRIHFNGKHQ